MDLPLPVITAFLTTALGGAGFLLRRAVKSFDAIASTQVLIAQTLSRGEVTSETRHDEVMGALGRIAEAIGLQARVAKLEEIVKGKVPAAPASQNGGSRAGSRPGRGG